MTKRALTERLALSLTANGKSQHEHFDGYCSGLLLRVYASGRKTWDFVYRSPIDDKRARMRIGPYPAITLAAARERAMAAQIMIANRKDPREVQKEPLPKTMAGLIEDWLSMTMRGKKRSAESVEWRLNKYIIPIVGKVRVTDFRIDPHYNSVIDPVLFRNRTRTAGLLFQDMRALMNFALQRGVIEYSRIARIKRPDEPNHRTRYLDLQEIVHVWKGLPTVLSRSDHVPTILKLCLVTGQRLSEVAGMRRSELDISARLWTIPAERSKNKHSHIVPVTNLALALINEAMRTTNGEFLFPNRSGDGPLKHPAIDHALLNAQKPREGLPLGKFKIPSWRPHDLRRTVATQMSRRENGLSISHIDISQVLNHRTVTKSSITQMFYDQNDYLDEKRDALERWDGFLCGLTCEKNAEEHGTAASHRQGRRED